MANAGAATGSTAIRRGGACRFFRIAGRSEFR